MASAYLIKFAAINRYFVRNHSLLERGENSYESNNVINIKFDVDLMVIRGKVSASMKNRSYIVDIFLTQDFEIENAKCECPRGIQICHHIAAVLFAAHYEISRTDVGCTWSPKPVNLDDIKTFREQFNFPAPKRVTDRVLRLDEIAELWEQLNELQPVGFRWILKPEPETTLLQSSNMNFPEISTILFSHEYVEALNPTKFLQEKMKLSEGCIKQIAELTVRQASNSDWYIIRKFRITASNFGKVINAIRRNRFPPSLFATLAEQKDLSRIKAIQWGIHHEKDGLDVLARTVKKDIKQTGVWLSESGALGASPDGVIDSETIVEVKCSYKYRQSLLTDALKQDEAKSYIIHYDDSGRLTVNKNHCYYHQVQGQIYLTKSKFAYLCVWTPKQAIICKVEKDIRWGSNIIGLEEFYFKRLIPYLSSNVS